MSQDTRDPVWRRSIRLQGFDYTRPGAYFVTVCVRHRVCLLGTVANGTICLSDAGRLVDATWKSLPQRFPALALDESVVMPNHVHAILVIPPTESIAPSLGVVVRTFKAVSSRSVHQTVLTMFAWQPNYYEHVIRNDDELARIRHYIESNPVRWSNDRENPAAHTIAAAEPWEL